MILTQENVPALFDNNTSFYTRVEGERVATLEQVTYGTMINVLPRLSSAGNSVEMEVTIEDGGLSRDKSGKVADVEWDYRRLTAPILILAVSDETVAC